MLSKFPVMPLLSLLAASCAHIKNAEPIVGEKVLNLREYCGVKASKICSLKFENYQIARRVRNKLYKSQSLIYVAESMTVGHLSGAFGEIDWTGGAYAGGIISYATSVKNIELNVTNKNDLEVMSKDTALEMLKAMEKKAGKVNRLQNKDAKLNVFVSVTGAATTWKSKKPHVYIGVKNLGKASVVKRYNLDQRLSSRSIERAYNIQLAVRKALELLDAELK